MRYRLKDRELQKTLDELSDGGFSRQLEEHQERILTGIQYQKQATIWFCKSEGPCHALEITPNMIEEVPAYNPRAWNKYPDVTPPEGVCMRVERGEGPGIQRGVARYVAINGDGCAWMHQGIVKNVDRFRPWDDPEEEDEE